MTVDLEPLVNREGKMCCLGSCVSCILTPMVQSFQRLPLWVQVAFSVATMVGLGVMIWFLRALAIHVYHSL